MDRRRMLGLFAAGGGALMLGACGEGADKGGFGSPNGGPGGPPPTIDNGPVVSATGSEGTKCVGYAQETNGPYPADGTNSAKGGTSNALKESGILRSDIRPDFLTNGVVAAGVPLTLNMRLVDVNDACRPLQSYAVYAWQCDAAGEYSLYNLPERSYLRGVQVADEEGCLSFTTVFPGCYAGRYPHIHFEVFSSLDKATSGKHALLVSQFAMDDAACDEVYRDSRYAGSAARFSRLSIASDGVFGDNGEERMAAMTPAMEGSVAKGFVAEAIVGIAT